MANYITFKQTANNESGEFLSLQQCRKPWTSLNILKYEHFLVQKLKINKQKT